MTLMKLERRGGRTLLRSVLPLAVLLVTLGGVNTPALFSQSADTAAPDLKAFAGTWHWMFQQKPVIAMTLVPAGDHFTGKMSNGGMSWDGEGNLTEMHVEPGESDVVRSFFVGKVLHVIVRDPRDKTDSEWTMTLVEPDKAEVSTSVEASSGQNKPKPWTAERSK